MPEVKSTMGLRSDLYNQFMRWFNNKYRWLALFQTPQNNPAIFSNRYFGEWVQESGLPSQWYKPKAGAARGVVGPTALWRRLNLNIC